MSPKHMQGLICFLISSVCLMGCGRGSEAASVGYTATSSQQLTADGEALLRDFLETAELPDLRQPNFADYQLEAKKFYDSFQDTLPWLQQGKPTAQARATIRSFQNAEEKGLIPDDYDGRLWNERLAQIDKAHSLPEADLVRFDLAVTICSMRYISDLHVGRVNPRLFHFDLEIDHTNFDLARFLKENVVGSRDVDATIETVEPPFPVYYRTEAALKKYLELESHGDGEPLPVPTKAVKSGGSYADLAGLSSRLIQLGDLPANYKSGEIYEGSIVEAVKHFQKRHGLEADGVITPATVTELNVPLARRITQLQLTMERLRWLPHEFERPPIVVNIPEFRLHADDEEYHWALSMAVVVGKAYRHETPVFASEINAVIFRPYWDVPSSILRAEIIPHLESDPEYLSENSYEIVDKSGKVVPEGNVSEPILDELRAGQLRVRQKPGDENALGLVKFNIPSPYDVYMHGTPARELFSRTRRDFSHGCIRLEDPVALAQWVMRDMPQWTEETIRAAMNGSQTLQVKLNKPIPVLILYSTAVVTEDGTVSFFADIYGNDTELQKALAQRHSDTEGYDPPGAGR